jgi:hypothetical protein
MSSQGFGIVRLIEDLADDPEFQERLEIQPHGKLDLAVGSEPHVARDS